MLNILTFNCQKGYQPGFKKYITEVINSKNYDFILLQEVNEDVIEIITPIIKHNGYNRVYNNSPVTDKSLRISILYKEEYEFLRSDFITFSPIVFQQLTETGSIAALFEVPRKIAKFIGKKTILIIVTHLHGSYHLTARKKEIMQIKKQANFFVPKSEHITIIGGDFNNLLPGEQKFNDLVMRPQYTNVSDFEDHTYDSAHLEDMFRNFSLARPFFMLKKNWKMKLDYIYLDRESAKKFTYKSNVIPVIASDHRPVELKFISNNNKK